MKAHLIVQRPDTPENESIQAHLSACVKHGNFDSLRVAVAYATVSGVRSLLSAFDGQSLQKSRWVIGLDDAVTQPGAIEFLRTLKNGEVRLASFEAVGRRFHPKLYAFSKIDDANAVTVMIGSANLTASAFLGNSEAVAFLNSKGGQTTADFETIWNQLWMQGRAITDLDFQSYAEKYERTSRLKEKYKKLVTKTPPKGASQEVLASDEAEIDPSIARICWIECGNVTAMGRELELKAEQGIFFGLSPAGGKSKNIDVEVSDGSIIALRMKYQGNHMWRLQMNNQVPEVKAGLRPIKSDGKLDRSPYVAVFDRVPGKKVTKLRFIDKSSAEFVALRQRTLKSGTLGKTTAREYGWCR